MYLCKSLFVLQAEGDLEELQSLVQRHDGLLVSGLLELYIYIYIQTVYGIFKHEQRREKNPFCIYAKTKVQISCPVTAQLISAISSQTSQKF